MTQKKKFLFIFITFLIIFPGVFLVGEVGVRSARALYGKRGYIWLPDDYLGVSHVPNSRFIFEEDLSREFRIKRKINSLGWVGSEISVEKPENVFRIVILGDSFTEGLRTEEGKNFCEQLQSLLNQNPPLPNKKFEVINGGVASYSPISEYLSFKRELIRLNPDWVLLQLFANDLLNIKTFRPVACPSAARGG